MHSSLSPEKKRLSVIVNPYNPPSPISPIFDQTPLPFSPESYLVPQTVLSQVAVDEHAPQTARPGKKMRPRPQSYGGSLAPGTLELILDFESRIAELEARHTRTSMELEEARDALNSERAVRRSSHRFSTLSHARFSSTSSSTNGSDDGSQTNDADYERRLRDELQDSIKKLRAQHASIARSLRQREETCASLSSALEKERVARKTAEDEVATLTALNSILLQRDSDAALPEDIASAISRTQAEVKLCTPSLSSSSLNKASTPIVQSSETTVEGPCPSDLGSARDELHTTQARLSAVEEECTTLRERVSSLQQELVMCLDSSSQALDVERELRADVEERARILAEENVFLKSIACLEEAFPNGHAPDAWIKRSPSTDESRRAKRLSLVQKDFHPDLKKDTLGPLLDRRRRVAISKKIREHRTKRLTMAERRKDSSLANPSLEMDISKRLPAKIHLPEVPSSPELSTCSTKVAHSPPPSKRARAGMSVIMAATLSKNHRPTWTALKAHSSLFVDVGSRFDAPMPQLDSVPVELMPKLSSKPSKDLRTFILHKASALFYDLGHSHTPIDTAHECSDETVV